MLYRALLYRACSIEPALSSTATEEQMSNVRIIAVVVAGLAVVIPSAAVAQDMPAGKTYTLSGELLSGYQKIQQNLAEAAEKMPADQYGFKPTPEIKPFGQLVAHVALAQFSTCAVLKGEPSPKKEEKEDATRTKTEAIALLKASTAYCDPLVTALNDAAMPELTKMGANQVAKGLVPAGLVSHGNEMYGTMSVYLRLKGIVPPSTERMKQKQQMSKSQ
jgi:hypothetical protein